MMDARERPARSLPSRTERVRTELGNPVPDGDVRRG